MYFKAYQMIGKRESINQQSIPHGKHSLAIKLQQDGNGCSAVIFVVP